VATQILELTGSAVAKPPVGSPSGLPTTLVTYDEKLALSRTVSNIYTLTVDTAVSVSLGALTGVNFLSIRTDGAKVRVRLTSTDGSQQSVPVDTLLILRCDSVDITAIDLTRATAIDTDVAVVLGQKA
jgi:hypothetical protein